MRLATKLVAILLLGIFLFTGIRTYYAVKSEEQEFAAEVAAETEHIVLAMRETVSDLGHDWGRVITLRQIEVAADRQGMSVHLLEPDGLPDSIDSSPTNRQSQWVLERDATGTVHARSFWPLAGSQMWLEFSKPVTELHLNKNAALYRNLWVAGATGVLAVLLVAVVGVRMVGRPIEMLVEKTRRIAKGDLSVPVELNTRDELGELARSINDMCDRLAESQQRAQEEAEARVRAVEQLRHADRLRTVGRLGAGVAHELGTPLNVVSGRAALIASGKLSDEDIVKSAATIKSEADRMTALIRKLLDFARRNTPQRSIVDLSQLTRETSELLLSLAKKKGVALDVRAEDVLPENVAESREGEAPAEPHGGRDSGSAGASPSRQPTPGIERADLKASVDRGQVQQVLTNLIMNAVQAMPDGGRVDMELDRTRATPPPEANVENPREADYVRIAVKDGGLGIPPEILDQVFEPFFTTKEVGEGTGLGLSIAHGIVQDHGGWIDVTSEPGQGTCFTVYLPGESPA